MYDKAFVQDSLQSMLVCFQEAEWFVCCPSSIAQFKLVWHHYSAGRLFVGSEKCVAYHSSHSGQGAGAGHDMTRSVVREFVVA